MFASVPPATGVSVLEAAVCSDAEVLASLAFSVPEAEAAWLVSLALLLSAATLPLNGVKEVNRSEAAARVATPAARARVFKSLGCDIENLSQSHNLQGFTV